MSNSNKLNFALALQSVAVKLSAISKKVQSVFDAGKGANQWSAFCLKTGEHYELPEGMTKISEYVFAHHLSLKTVGLPSTLQTIENSAFEGSPVRVGQFPDSLEEISYDAFYNSDNLAVVFSPGISKIGSSAFYGNANLKEVTFVKTNQKSGTPAELADDAFDNCPNLVKINVPWGEGEVPGAPWGAVNATVNYKYWDNIPDVFHFPEGFEKIPDYLFYDTTATTAKEIYLGDECKEVGEASFYRATKLKTVHLPDGLKKIGAYGFRHCSALELSELPDSVEVIEKSAFEKTLVALSKLPNSLNKIGTNCFSNCSRNNFTEIPAGVVSIESNAFLNNTGLTEVTFLGTPAYIKNTAFSGCENLSEIYVPWGKDDPINENAPWGADDPWIFYNRR